MRAFLAAAFGGGLLALAVPARAQARPEAKVEFSIGGAIVGPTRFEGVSANQITPQGGIRPLFRTQSELLSTAGIWTRVGVRLVPRLSLEAGVTLHRPSLVTQVTNDAEAGSVDLSTTVTRYGLEGGLLADLARWRRGRARPFASAGVGYLRQVSEGRILVETGRTYYAGGGLHYVLRDDRGRRVQFAGVRFDFRALVVGGPLSLDGAARVSPSLGAGLFIRF